MAETEIIHTQINNISNSKYFIFQTNMAEDVSDEEYLDDPIRLFDSEHSRVYYTETNGK